MSLQTFELTVFETPKSLNAGGAGSRQHWGKAYKEKRKWQEAWLTEMMVAKVPKYPRSAVLQIAIHWKHKRRRDVDNYYSGTLKPLGDALQVWGMRDDTPEYLRVEKFEMRHCEIWPPFAGRATAFIVVAMTLEYDEEVDDEQ